MRPEPVKHRGPVDVDHLINDHGLSRKVVKTRSKGGTSGAKRNLTLYLEMQHGIDHAQRTVGHEHN